MNHPTRTEPCKIYQFPKRNRVGSEAARHRQPEEIVRAPAQPVIALGGAWYHQAAIEEAERPQKS
jgi:hypothetical protein